MALHIHTPLLQSRPLSLLTGKTVWLKMEALQPVGSFKIRGIGAVCETYARQGKTRFVSSSGGNAGIAAAYAGRQLNIPVTVVVPETTTARAKALIEQEGAEVIVHGASWMEANALAQSLLDDSSAFIHPFDNAEMWAGHGSLIDEAVEADIGFDSVIVAVGGGGLLSGVIAGLQRNGLGQLPVLAVETNGADSLAQSVAAGKRIELPAITSIATSLGAKAVCENAFAVTQQHPVRCATVSDAQALAACEQFLHDHRVLVEPACAAALATLYSGDAALLSEFQRPLVVVCGGATATLEQIQAWRKQLG
ncbi:pyridoxal-phosphate dependent enzyme [Pseudomonas sp. GV071]|uniref:pyridoxal-phosphate dependent enzyme n=1 Tax=Pseudomonas sp. GV071 TaxID=2135754 RepID=UPI000D396824|nr:pyridoxal-phosphate dependent enzyme [Pseudomonas sp. GV071]PTQ74268.1 L-serine ammonia-lyase [Pseudomonas sp. GV071]